MDSALNLTATQGSAMLATVESRRLGFGDIFDDDQLKSGAIIVYVLVTFYMFLALSIVCDEFFVPALEVISARLKLPNDVAGATFMAAGGSAPEFFTSLIGNFLGDSSVGISTIVGSAVFNVLLVIGACAFVAPEPLALTWFPLARDATFYAVDLLVLSVFFMDEEIQVWESLLLFLLYVAYCVFMVYTSRIEEWAYCKFGRPKGAAAPADKDKMESDMIGVPLADAVDAVDPDAPLKKDESNRVDPNPAPTAVESGPPEDTDAVVVDVGNSQGAEVEEAEVAEAGQSGDAELSEDAGDLIKAKSKAKKGQSKAKAKAKQGKKSGTDMEARKSKDSTIQQEASHGAAPFEEESVDDDPSQPDEESMILTNRKLLHDTMHGAGSILEAHAKNIEKRRSRSSSAGSISGSPAAEAEAPAAAGGEEDEEEDEGGPVDLSWPADGSVADKVYYVFAVPLLASLMVTVPDVRREGWEKFFIISFALSILWIAIYTYFMVESITVVSEVLEIPVTIFALTIVAAGTSVPDMLTSIIVARKGRGDMAVSSSIGSNIFDVTVGMPLPWLIYMCFEGITMISVGAKGLLFSVSLLLGMLVVTILAIMACKWVMSTALGGAMVVLYIVFLVVCLIQMS